MVLLMQTTSRKEIAENVRVAMTRRQVDQVALAPQLGMSRSALSDRCRGLTHFRVDELQAIAALLDVPFEDLVAPHVQAEAAG